jgi:hypothetical protein
MAKSRRKSKAISSRTSQAKQTAPSGRSRTVKPLVAAKKHARKTAREAKTRRDAATTKKRETPRRPKPKVKRRTRKTATKRKPSVAQAKKRQLTAKNAHAKTKKRATGAKRTAVKKKTPTRRGRAKPPSLQRARRILPEVAAIPPTTFILPPVPTTPAPAPDIDLISTIKPDPSSPDKTTTELVSFRELLDRISFDENVK